jgi:hypothetical protein
MPTVTRLSWKFCLSLGALSACALLWAQPAAAAFASFSIPANSVSVGLGASTSNGFIELPSTGTPQFVINLVLPRDYDPDSEVRIIFQFLSNGPDCDIRFRAIDMFRMRAGDPFEYGLTGLSGGNTTTHLAQGVVVQKNFNLNPGPAPAGQNPSDAFMIRFARLADQGLDTCSNTVSIGAIDIRYQIAP